MHKHAWQMLQANNKDLNTEPVDLNTVRPFSGLVRQKWLLSVYRNRCTDMHTWTRWKTTVAVNRKSEANIKAGVHQLWSDRRCIFKSRFLFQDTVVALQALSTFTALGGSHDIDLTVKVETDPSTTVAAFHIRQDNYLLHQSQQVHWHQKPV